VVLFGLLGYLAATTAIAGTTAVVPNTADYRRYDNGKQNSVSGLL
jgi:hypothetical protein